MNNVQNFFNNVSSELMPQALQSCTEDWESADGIFNNTEILSTFEVDDTEFVPATGEYKYFNDSGDCVIIDTLGLINLNGWNPEN